MKNPDNKCRLLDIFYQLMWDNHVTVNSIARNYEVSEKTIKRDISMIRSLDRKSVV